MNVLGLDLSLNSTGYAYRAQATSYDAMEVVTGRITTGKLRGVSRLDFLEECLQDIIKDGPFTLAVIEDYAMGYGGNKSNPGRVFNIGEWGGIARLSLHRASIPLVLVSPSSLKMFATGNGGSAIQKHHVMSSIQEVWDYRVDQDDEADAFVCMMLGEAYSSQRKRRRYDSSRIRALDKVEYVPALEI